MLHALLRELADVKEAIKQGKPPSKQETVDRYYDLVEVKVDYERDEEGKLKKDEEEREKLRLEKEARRAKARGEKGAGEGKESG